MLDPPPSQVLELLLELQLLRVPDQPLPGKPHTFYNLNSLLRLCALSSSATTGGSTKTSSSTSSTAQSKASSAAAASQYAPVGTLAMIGAAALALAL